MSDLMWLFIIVGNELILIYYDGPRWMTVPLICLVGIWKCLDEINRKLIG